MYGFVCRSFTETNRKVDEYKVSFQEYDPENPHELILRTLVILLAQDRLFNAIRMALPEVDDPILLDSRLPQFHRGVAHLWSHMKEAYPLQVSRWEKDQGDD
jgi:hypothetical protein